MKASLANIFILAAAIVAYIAISPLAYAQTTPPVIAIGFSGSPSLETNTDYFRFSLSVRNPRNPLFPEAKNISVRISQRGDFITSIEEETSPFFSNTGSVNLPVPAPDGISHGNIIIGAGNAGINLRVGIDDDEVDEASGLITFEILAGDGYVVNQTRAVAVANIADNDPPLSLAADTRTIESGDSHDILLVAETPASQVLLDHGVAVLIRDPNDTTTSIGRNNIIRVPLFAGTNQTLFMVQTRPGAVGNFSVEVLSGFGYRVSSASQLNFTVADVPPPPVMLPPRESFMLTFAPDAPRNKESKELSVNLTLAQSEPAPLVVSYFTSDITATSGADYQHATGEVVFATGETSKTITIQTREDDLFEKDETLAIFANTTLANGSVVSINTTATIKENDEAPDLSLSAPSEVKPGENVTFTITSNRTIPPKPVKVHLEVSGWVGRIYSDVSQQPPISKTPVAPGADVSSYIVVALPANTSTTRFIVEAAAGNGSGLPPIVATLMGGANYTINGGAVSRVVTLQGSTSGDNTIASVNKEILPRVVLAMADDTLDAIGKRVQTVFQHRDSHVAMQLPTQPRASLTGDAGVAGVLAAGDKFALPLAGGDGRGGGIHAGFWGEGFFNTLDASLDAIDFHGDMAGGVMGIDFIVNGDSDGGMLAGIGISQGQADFTYQHGINQGSHKTDLTSYTPYLGWRFQGGGAAWAAIGAGGGEVTIDASDDSGFTPSYMGEVEWESLGAGFVRPWGWKRGRQKQQDSPDLDRDGVGLTIQGDVALVRVTETPTPHTQQEFTHAFPNNPNLLSGIKASVGRVQFGATLARHRRSEAGSRMQQELAVTARYDGGDIDDSASLDLAGSWAVHGQNGFYFDLTAHTLIAHSEAEDEWGVEASGGWVADQSGAGRGLAVHLTPKLGDAPPATLVSPATDRDTGEVARYGFSIRHGIALSQKSLLSPFMTGDAGNMDATTIGSAFTLGTGFMAGVDTRPNIIGRPSRAFLRYSRAF
ncbi:MAG: hypothetical protein MJE68_20250 [Proteobacteria bacterium]|nr:hypothetical protein [Pseudomonadota bacterium]